MADRSQEFRDRLGVLIDEYRDVLAPVRCSVCADDENCDHDPRGETAAMIPDVMLTEWLLIHQWSSFAKAGGYWDWNTSAGMTMTSAVGLLVTAKQDALRNL